jgi:hypothetical protein
VSVKDSAVSLGGDDGHMAGRRSLQHEFKPLIAHLYPKAGALPYGAPEELFLCWQNI